MDNQFKIKIYYLKVSWKSNIFLFFLYKIQIQIQLKLLYFIILIRYNYIEVIIMNIDINKTWCFTGHRPNKLYGYKKHAEGNLKLIDKLHDILIYLHENFEIDTFISGMAIGWDLWSAMEVLNLKNKGYKLKLICAIPCKEQEKNYSIEDKSEYYNILNNADYIYNVTGINYSPLCMQIRNKWMVNNSSGQIACWDGSKGGTYNCIMYANKVLKTNRIIINPKNFNVSYYIKTNA